MTIRRPGLPSIDLNLPYGLSGTLGPMKEAIEISMGMRSPGKQVGAGVGYDGWKRRSVTLGMLIKIGLIDEATAIQLYNSEP